MQDHLIKSEELTEVVHVEKQKLFPTDVAAVVNDFLVQHFSDITDYNFTAHVEKELDKIAQGSKIWNQMLAEFYTDFYLKVQSTADIDRSIVNYTRVLGKDPQTNASVMVRLGKYGPLVQLGIKEDEQEAAPRFAGLRAHQRMETITLAEALDLFKLPRIIGTVENLPLVANIGKFGPYIKHGSLFYSIPKEHDPFTINEQQAIEIIVAKRKANAEKLIKSFPQNPDIQILNGRWGPYIKNGKKHVRLPKDIADPLLLSLEECLVLLDSTPVAKKTKNTH